MKYPLILKKRAALVLALASFPALIGCGSRNSDPTTAALVPGVISPGLIGGLSSSCVPITGPMGFTGQGVYVSYATIIGGQQPSAVSAQTPTGQIIMGPGGQGPYGIQTAEGTNVSMDIEPLQTGTAYSTTGAVYPQNTPTNIVVPGQANVTGTITLSALTQSDIMARMGGYTGTGVGVGTIGTTYPYTGYPQTSIASSLCVIGMGMNISHYGQRLYGGNFYLYFSNGQVYPLPI